jgi:hypothetical protein
MTGTRRSAYGYNTAAAAASERWGVDALDEPLAQVATRGDILYVLTHHVGPFFWLRLRLCVREEEVAPIYLVGESGSVALHDEKTAFAQVLADAQPEVRENSAAIASVYAMLRTGIVADADAIPRILAGRWIEHVPNGRAAVEPPHFEGRVFTFCVRTTNTTSVDIVRVAVDAETLHVTEEIIMRRVETTAPRRAP